MVSFGDIVTTWLVLVVSLVLIERALMVDTWWRAVMNGVLLGSVLSMAAVVIMTLALGGPVVR